MYVFCNGVRAHWVELLRLPTTGGCGGLSLPLHRFNCNGCLGVRAHVVPAKITSACQSSPTVNRPFMEGWVALMAVTIATTEER